MTRPLDTSGSTTSSRLSRRRPLIGHLQRPEGERRVRGLTGQEQMVDAAPPAEPVDRRYPEGVPPLRGTVIGSVYS